MVNSMTHRNWYGNAYLFIPDGMTILKMNMMSIYGYKIIVYLLDSSVKQDYNFDLTFFRGNGDSM